MSKWTSGGWMFLKNIQPSCSPLRMFWKTFMSSLPAEEDGVKTRGGGMGQRANGLWRVMRLARAAEALAGRPVAGRPVTGPRSASAELPRAARRALSRRGSRAGALPRRAL